MSDPLTFIYILEFTCQCLWKQKQTNKKRTNFDRDRYINLGSIAILNLLVPWAWFSLVQSLSHVWLSATPWTAACHTSLSIPTPGVYLNSCSLSQWCHPTISPCLIPFSSYLQSFPALGSFQMSQFFMSGDQSTGVTASASVLQMNIQNWFPLRLTGWISLQSKGLSRVFSNTTVQKNQFFGAQLSL